jgi:hypothetical protein
MTIREVGLYFLFFSTHAGVGGNGPYMISRDNLDATGSDLAVAVASGGAIEIRYNFYFDGSGGIMHNLMKNIYAGSISSASFAIPTVSNTFGSSATTTAMVFNLTTANTHPTIYDHMHCTPGSAVEIGIICGASGTQGSSGNDFVLAGQYTQGFNFGQMDYQGTNVVTPMLTGATGSSFYFERQIFNKSAFTQTIREFGVYCAGGASAGKTNANWMMFRKIIPGTIVLSANQSALIGLRWQFAIN